MKTTIVKALLFMVIPIALILYSFQIPEGWIKGGSQKDSYEMTTEKGIGPQGTNVATIKAIDRKIKGFGTLMQNSSPEKYRGKRVRMSGEMKSKDVTGWAGFWFRIDQSNPRQSLSFDNMHDGKSDRSIKGTTDWQKYEIVLDVPDNSSNMAFGALLNGTGQIWFTNIKFEIVDNTIPTTGKEKNYDPTNLNFEK